MSPTLRLALLGDSIACGEGAARPQDRLGQRLVAGLAEHGVPASLSVVAVLGARSADLSAQVDVVLREPPDIAVIVVGANDLTHLVPHSSAAAALGGAVRRLRDRSVRVVVAPAPDLSMVPHLPPVMRPAVRAASDQLRALQVAAVEEAGGQVADDDHATSRSFRADPALFAADRFHPSSEGYAVIAASLLPRVVEAASNRTG